MEQLQKRISTITMCSSSCARDELKAEQVEVKRYLVRRLFLESMNEKPRPWRKSNNSFGQILRASAEEVHTYIDLDLFLNIVSDIAVAFHGEKMVMFSPPLERLQSRLYVQKAEIRFGNMSLFLDWLDITQEDLRNALRVKRYTESGASVMRILGSMQYNEGNVKEPLHIYPFSSSSDVSYTENFPTIVDQIEFENATWDEENGTFVCRPARSSGTQGDMLRGDVRSTFALCWETLAPLQVAGNVAAPLDPSGVNLGKLVMRYPLVYARGSEFVSTLFAMLPTDKI